MYFLACLLYLCGPIKPLAPFPYASTVISSYGVSYTIRPQYTIATLIADFYPKYPRVPRRLRFWLFSPTCTHFWGVSPMVLTPSATVLPACDDSWLTWTALDSWIWALDRWVVVRPYGDVSLLGSVLFLFTAGMRVLCGLRRWWLNEAAWHHLAISSDLHLSRSVLGFWLSRLASVSSVGSHSRW